MWLNILNTYESNKLYNSIRLPFMTRHHEELEVGPWKTARRRELWEAPRTSHPSTSLPVASPSPRQRMGFFLPEDSNHPPGFLGWEQISFLSLYGLCIPIQWPKLANSGAERETILPQNRKVWALPDKLGLHLWNPFYLGSLSFLHFWFNKTWRSTETLLFLIFLFFKLAEEKNPFLYP